MPVALQIWYLRFRLKERLLFTRRNMRSISLSSTPRLVNYLNSCSAILVRPDIEQVKVRRAIQQITYWKITILMLLQMISQQDLLSNQ